MEDPPNTQVQQVSFLPINQPSSPPSLKTRRAYLSCDRCRKRKTRCEPLHGLQQPCKRCAQESQPCDFRSTRGTKRKAHQSAVVDRQSAVATRLPNQDHLESPTESPPAEMGQDRPLMRCPANHSVRSSLLSAQLHNPADALDLLTVTAAGCKDEGTPPRRTPIDSRQSLEEAHTARPADASHREMQMDRDRNIWDNFILVRKGILKEEEVVEYIGFFFTTLWPLRPIIPAYYREQSNYTALVAEEPVLVICLVTIASRYHPLSGPHGNIRTERAHWRTWPILQSLLQSVLWGTTFTRSLGTISAMLLLMEWHVKAINTPKDFAGDGFGGLVEELTTSANLAGSGRPSAGRSRYGNTALMEKMDVVAPAYRSNKMSWMLLSNAIALAHEGHCFENGSHGAARDIESDPTRQEWNKVLCVFIYFADEHLSARIGIEPLLPERSRAAVQDRLALGFANSLPNKTLWEDYFELTVQARKARSFLHSLKLNGDSATVSDLIPDLERLSRGLSRWKIQHEYHQHGDSNPIYPGYFLNACVEMEYYYTMMYSLAPASQIPDYLKSSGGPASQPPNDPTSVSHFAQQATQASYALLTIVIDVLHPAGLLAYLPVRCWLFIVAASLHLLKVTTPSLSISAVGSLGSLFETQATVWRDQAGSSSQSNILLIRMTIDALGEGSPDDTHMAMRYSRFLDSLLKSSFTPQSGTDISLPGMDEGSGFLNAQDWTSLQSIGLAEFGDFPVPFDPIFNDLIFM